MIDKFLTLDASEQKRILDSAYQAFTDTAYTNASTNQITKDANISKGKLFYYFKNKETLFHYLVSKGLKFIKDSYVDLVNIKETDFLKRYQMISEIKRKAYLEEPHLFNFMAHIYMHEINRIKKEDLKAIEHYQRLIKDQIKEGVDTSLFRDDIEPEMVIRLLTYSLEGYEQNLIKQMQHIDMKNIDIKPYYDDYYEVLEKLREVYYK